MQNNGGFFQVNRISKNFGPHNVLSGVSLQVAKGEMLCLLGPSGCGKTTLLRIMAGLELPDEGTVTLLGEDITFLQPEKRHFGFVFQNYALFPNLTVSDNISYGLRGYAAEKRRQKVRELLRLVELEEYARSYPGELSGGQQQRVALARALAPDSQLLLMDEPLSALDAQVRGQLREELRAIQRHLGITAILVTHDQEEALALADRVALMHNGHIDQIDTPQALYERPATRFAAEFIGSMNILALPQLGEERPFGIRYEDVLVREATEAALRSRDNVVCKLNDIRLLGAFRRLELVLCDQKTLLYADIPATLFQPETFRKGSLMAVTLPVNRRYRWENA